MPASRPEGRPRTAKTGTPAAGEDSVGARGGFSLYYTTKVGAKLRPYPSKENR